MTVIHESKAMAEIRAIREELSNELKPLSHDERVALMKKGAAQFEDKFGIKLKRLGNEDVKSSLTEY
jgi:hypothetical protein